MDNKNNAIPKKIYEAISLTTSEQITKSYSTNIFFPKNLILLPIDENENENLKRNPSKEYKIGNYMIKHTLGQGTFGKVKLGVYSPNNEKVAIKILEKNRIVEKDDEIRVKREFDMLAQFNHPNVILVAEIFESEDSFYSVMEFCEGGELFNYIVKKNRLSENESAFFFYQLINGLEYIHSLGIVHRDLKPENLLLTIDNILKIIDFGLSNYFKENQEPLLSTPCGSPCYASPEMVAGKKYDGFKIDVWSCGIILYAMVCGYLPFEDPNNEVLFKKILECNVEFPNYVKKLSKDLVKKILVTDPEKRITIPEIKQHPFYLKGKELFEQEFSITQVVKTPEEKENIKEKECKENIVNNLNENKKENNISNQNIKESINKENEPKLININKNNNKEIENNNNKLETNIKNKENINIDKIKEENIEMKEKEESIEIIENEGNERKKNKEINIKKEIKEIKEKEENKIKEINNKKEMKEKEENKEKIVKRAPKRHYLNIIKNEKNNNNKNIILTEQEQIYKPLKTEYIVTSYRLDSKEKDKNISEDKEEDISNMRKKNNNFTEFNYKKKIKINLKEEQKGKIKDKNKDIFMEGIKKKEKDEKIKEKKNKISKENKKDKEIIKLNPQNRRKNENSSINNKNNNIQENKRTITPRKKVHIKNIKIQTNSNYTNTTINTSINKKINTQKYLIQKTNFVDNLVLDKENMKLRSNIKKINSYNKASQQIRKIINSFQNFKKVSIDKKNNNTYLNNDIKKHKQEIKEYMALKEIKPIERRNKKTDLYDENKWKRLNTEIIQARNKNSLETTKKVVNFNNTTLDSIRNNIGENNIPEIKKNYLLNKNKKKKFDLNFYISERKRKNDIKRIKSTNFEDTNTINTNSRYNNPILKTNLRSNRIGRNLINNLNIRLNKDIEFNNEINNFSNKKSIESEIYDNNVKTEPSSYFLNRISNRENQYSNIKTNANNNQFSRIHGTLYPKKHNNNNNQISASYFSYLHNTRRVPNYNLIKKNNQNNLIKNIHNNDILKNNYIYKDKRFINHRTNESTSLTKKNPFVSIRNTVINYNIIDPGLILPSFKKYQDRRKYHYIGSYDTNTQIQPTKKYLRESTEMYNQKTFTNSINKISNINTNSGSKPLVKYKTIETNHSNNHSLSINNNSIYSKELYSGSRRLRTQTQENSRNNVISSFNKFVNNMKNKQLYNKIQSSSVKKNHLKFKSMKLNDKYYRNNNQNNKKISEIAGTNTSINNKFKSINTTSNYTLPSLVVKTKKFFNPRRKGYLIISQGRTLKLTTPTQQNTFESIGMPNYIKGVNLKYNVMNLK